MWVLHAQSWIWRRLAAASVQATGFASPYSPMGGAREIRPVYGRRCLVSAPGAPPRKLTGSRNHPAIAGRSMARITIVDDEPPVLRSLAPAVLRRAKPCGGVGKTAGEG